MKYSKYFAMLYYVLHCKFNKLTLFCLPSFENMVLLPKRIYRQLFAITNHSQDSDCCWDDVFTHYTLVTHCAQKYQHWHHRIILFYYRSLSQFRFVGFVVCVYYDFTVNHGNTDVIYSSALKYNTLA